MTDLFCNSCNSLGCLNSHSSLYKCKQMWKSLALLLAKIHSGLRFVLKLMMGKISYLVLVLIIHSVLFNYMTFCVQLLIRKTVNGCTQFKFTMTSFMAKSQSWAVVAGKFHCINNTFSQNIFKHLEVFQK